MRTVPQLQRHGSPWTDVEEALAWWARLYQLTGNAEDRKAASKPMLCGKCGRRLGSAYASAPNGLPHAAPVDNHIGQPRQATGGGRSITDASIPEALAHERWEVTCHRKCGARHLVTSDALVKAFIITGEKGRGAIVVGSGRYAATSGGADL